MNLPPIETRMEQLLTSVAAFSRRCKACGEPLFFVQHQSSDKFTPYTKEGVNHFINCPAAKQFRKPKEEHAENSRN